MADKLFRDENYYLFDLFVYSGFNASENSKQNLVKLIEVAFQLIASRIALNEITPKNHCNQKKEL